MQSLIEVFPDCFLYATFQKALTTFLCICDAVRAKASSEWHNLFAFPSHFSLNNAYRHLHVKIALKNAKHLNTFSHFYRRTCKYASYLFLPFHSPLSSLSLTAVFLSEIHWCSQPPKWSNSVQKKPHTKKKKTSCEFKSDILLDSSL